MEDQPNEEREVVARLHPAKPIQIVRGRDIVLRLVLITVVLLGLLALIVRVAASVNLVSALQ